jgi:hypothetical protein
MVWYEHPRTWVNDTGSHFIHLTFGLEVSGLSYYKYSVVIADGFVLKMR